MHPSLYLFLLLRLWSPPTTHKHTHTQKQLRSICISFFFLYIFLWKMFDRLHQCKYWRGVERGSNKTGETWEKRHEAQWMNRREKKEMYAQRAGQSEAKRDEESRCSLYPAATLPILSMKDRNTEEKWKRRICITKPLSLHQCISLFHYYSYQCISLFYDSLSAQMYR